MRYGIGFKLGLLLATFSLVAMGLVGYYSYSGGRATLLAAAQRDLLTATQVLGRNFQANIDGVARDALLLVGLPTSSAMVSSREDVAAAGRDREVLTDTFTAMMATHPAYFQIRLIGAGQHDLERIRVDRDGDKLATVAATDLQEKAHYPYVFETLQLGRGQFYLSDITINHEEGAHSGLHKPTVRVASPVLGKDGKVQGLIVINLDLNGLFDMVEAMSRFSKAQVISVLPTTRKDEIGLLASSLNDMQNTIVANLRDLTESRQALEHLAQHDALTGLPNRALFNDRLHQAVSLRKFPQP